MTEQELQDRLVACANDYAAPGMALAVVRAGEEPAIHTVGFADATTQRPITPDTAFRIGSISKTHVGLAIMQLVEEGQVDLDDPIAKHLRSMEFVSAPGGPDVTLRHVMTHVSGVGEVRGWGELLRPGTGIGIPDGKPVPDVPSFYAGSPVRAEIHAGTKWAYANHAIGALGQVIEDVSGTPFAEHMRERVLEPLGMTGASFLRDERVGDRLATGYTLNRRGQKRVKYQHIVIPAAGSIFASITDMASYAAALLAGGSGPGGQVVKPESLEAMWGPQVRRHPSLSFAQGLSFMLETWEGHSGTGHRIAHHGGGWKGFISMLMVAPDDGVAVVALTNGMNPSSNVLARELLRDLLGLQPDADRLPVPGIAERPDLWAGLRGVYGLEPGLKTSLRPLSSTGGQVEVGIADGHLAIRTLIPPYRRWHRLYPTDTENPLVFAFASERLGHKTIHELVFTTGPDGKATSIDATISLPTGFVRLPDWRNVRTLARGAAATALTATAIRRRRRAQGG